MIPQRADGQGAGEGTVQEEEDVEHLPPEPHAAEAVGLSDLERVIALLLAMAIGSVFDIAALVTMLGEGESKDDDGSSPAFSPLLIAVMLIDGQGILHLGFFGGRPDVAAYASACMLTCRRVARKVLYSAQDVLAEAREPTAAEVDLANAIICADGVIVDRKHRLRTYRQCVPGKELIAWMVHAGHAGSRTGALALGLALQDAGLLRHVTDEHHFADAGYFYRVEPPPLAAPAGGRRGNGDLGPRKRSRYSVKELEAVKGLVRSG